MEGIKETGEKSMLFTRFLYFCERMKKESFEFSEPIFLKKYVFPVYIMYGCVSKNICNVFFEK